LLPGRNAALAEGFGWDIALWAEGWTPGVYAPDEQGKPKPVPGASLRIAVNPNQRTVLLRVPRRIFGAGFDPRQAAYLAAVLSQEGFPSPEASRIPGVRPADIACLMVYLKAREIQGRTQAKLCSQAAKAPHPESGP